MAVGSGQGLRFTGRKVDKETLPAVEYNRIQDRLHGRLLHDEDFCHYFDAAIASTQTQTDDTVFAVLIVPCM